MFNDVITLIKSTTTRDEYDYETITKVETEVFCEVRSIGQAEFYQAQSTGFRPEVKFVLADYYDYDNQQDVLYEGRRYNVVRTYRNGLTMELTCQGVVEDVNS